MKFSRSGATLHIFEDNEAVIKMIIKGRSRTMRHVSRTHRVALDWLFDRINLDPKSKSNMLTPKNQLADILTKGNFTSDEWNHLLCLFNISNFTSSSCQQTMSKRTQEGTGEERIVAKSKPMMNLVLKDMAESSTAPSSSASFGHGSLKATSHCLSLIASTGRPAAMETIQNQNPSASTGRPVAWGSDIIIIDLESPQEYYVSAASVPHMEKVYSKIATDNGSQPRRWNGRSRQKPVDLGNVHVFYFERSSSSWEELFGEPTYHQESRRETNFKAIVRGVTKIDQRSQLETPRTVFTCTRFPYPREWLDR